MKRFMKRIKKIHKQLRRINNDGVWNSIRNFMLTSPIVSLTTSIFLLLLGAYTAAIINFISSTGDALSKFIFSFSLSILVLILGFIFFFDFWIFRKKYSFIESQSKDLAEKIISIHERSQKTLTLVDGVNAIQFFQVERHTDDHHLLFKFKPIFSMKSHYFNMSAFKDKEIEVPIALFEWLASPQKTTIPDYDDRINNLVYQWITTKSETSTEYEELIREWNVELSSPQKISSIHFHVLFETKDILYDEDVANVNILEYVQKMNYNGIKSIHDNRQYCTLRFMLNSDFGSVEHLLLVIVNKKIVSDESLDYVLKRILM